MNNFKAEPIELRDAMLAATLRVMESGWYVLGSEVKEFEKQWAETCGVSYGVGVGNGLDAIEIALRILNIGYGDEVITTPMTAFATVLGILRSGATPVLADIDSDTALISIESAERCITKKTRAVVLVHLYGQMRKMNEWDIFCKQNDIKLIEDCAQSHLATWHGNVAGSFGSVGAFSFYPTKNLGAIGDAGMLITNDKKLFHLAKILRNYGQSANYHHSDIGMNSRLDELQAAILIERKKWLEEFTRKRQNIAEIYRLNINNNNVKQLAPPEQSSAHVHHLFVLNCKKRNDLQTHLRKNNIESLIHYPISIHQQEACKGIIYDPEGLNNSEYHSKTVLSLPCHPQMTEDDVGLVIAAVNSFKVY